ncbi:hypothetical protein SESBI_43757, partial [Sesbania bispinosa]
MEKEEQRVSQVEVAKQNAGASLMPFTNCHLPQTSPIHAGEPSSNWHVLSMLSSLDPLLHPS